MITFIAAIVGLLLGSFLSVLLGRWPHWRGAGSGRSECPNCHHTLAWYDLIPLASWLMLRGRCRYCHAVISPSYVALELTMGAVFGLYALRFGLMSPWSVMEYALLFSFVALFFFDLRHGMLPDAILLPMVVLIAVRRIAVMPDHLIGAVVAGAIIAGILGALYAISRGRWLGLGDVKLGFVIGFLFGYPDAIGVTLIAIWAGALIGIGLMATKRATMQTALPFGSFWVAAAIFAMLVPGPVTYISTLFIPLM